MGGWNGSSGTGRTPSVPQEKGGDSSSALKVYLETSFMFYLTGRSTTDAKIAADQAYTRRWWLEEGPKCALYTSPFVIIESNDRDPEYVDKRNEKISETLLLPVDVPLISEIAEKLLAMAALPRNEVTDAQHIATAAVHGMDYLLSWNCRHLANPHAFPRTKKIVESFGVHCPLILTPRSYLEDYSDEG